MHTSCFSLFTVKISCTADIPPALTIKQIKLPTEELSRQVVLTWCSARRASWKAERDPHGFTVRRSGGFACFDIVKSTPNASWEDVVNTA